MVGMRGMAAVAWFVVATAAAAVAAEGPGPPDAAAEMARGRESFEAKCRLCHTLQVPLSQRKTREEWGGTVKKMVLYGAALAPADREAVARYLAAQSLFAQRCGTCHEPTRVLDKAGTGRDWDALAARMAAHYAEMAKAGKAPAGAFSAQEAGEVGALLRVLVP